MNNIKNLRLALGLSQAQLAEACGLHQTAVSQWEKGRTRPDTGALEKLAEIFGVSVDFILGREIENKIPVLGFVQAGSPREVSEQTEGWVSFDGHGGEEHFALRVRGDSMLPRFRDGDLVIVRRQSTADNGEIAVVLAENSLATVKKVSYENGDLVLTPTNPDFEPIIYSPEEQVMLPVKIIGRVIELRAKI